jgi:hypothetical protein
MKHLSRISLQRPATAIVAPDYPPGILGAILRLLVAIKGIQD